MAETIGEFELRARERRLRAKLWKCLWVTRGAYDPDSDDSEWAFDFAMREEDRLFAEAVALGFRGDPSWVPEFAEIGRAARG